MRRIAGRAARAILRIPERVLHSRRRQQALDFLRGTPRPGSVLFVCYGNICRSPYAEYAFLREAAGTGIRAMSAGFIGPGRSSPANAKAVATQLGVSLEPHVSQVLTPELVREAGLIVVMEQKQKDMIQERFAAGARTVILGDFDPEPITARTVRDPYNQDESTFHEVYSRIDRCIRQMVEVLK